MLGLYGGHRCRGFRPQAPDNSFVVFMIRIEKIDVTVGRFRLRNLSLDLPAGQYSVLMGKTGSGKTTLLECICGLRTVESGSIFLAGRDVTPWPPAKRSVGYVPQDGALFPTMSVRDHLGFALAIRKWPRSEQQRRIAELATLLSIEHLLDRRPAGLSGGEAQRVALGRALSFHPQVLLLDEPLSALDDDTRRQMYTLLKDVQRATRLTALHVTHSREEADHLGDRVYQLHEGRVKPYTEGAAFRDQAIAGGGSGQ